MNTVEDRETRHIIRVSRDGREWVRLDLVYGIPANYGWQKIEAERVLSKVRRIVPEIGQGTMQIKIFAEDGRVRVQRAVIVDKEEPTQSVRPPKKKAVRRKKRGAKKKGSVQLQGSSQESASSPAKP